MRQPFRLLVIGSRTWDDTTAIEDALTAILARHPEGVILVHGDCPHGADSIESAYPSRTPGFRIEADPADWRRHGRAAGQLRNTGMSYRASKLVMRVRYPSPAGHLRPLTIVRPTVMSRDIEDTPNGDRSPGLAPRKRGQSRLIGHSISPWALGV